MQNTLFSETREIFSRMDHVLQIWSIECAWGVVGTNVESKAIVLLSGHDVLIKLPCKWFSLSSQINADVRFGQRGFVLQGEIVTAERHDSSQC